MEILIKEVHRSGDDKTYEIEAGKKEVLITLGGPNDDINVVVNNAAHKVYRGTGKYFDSFEMAADAYQSAAVKEALMTARDAHHIEIWGAA